jgi:hypothetical protein
MIAVACVALGAVISSVSSETPSAALTREASSLHTSTMLLALKASGSKKRQPNTCTPAEIMALRGAGQLVASCVMSAASNFTEICDCYTTYIDDLVPEINCVGVKSTINTVNQACDALSCAACGTNSTLPACTAAQNAVFTNAANVLGQCVQTVSGQYGCKCYEAFMGNTTSIDGCQLGHSARDNVHQVCQSLQCKC